jgi:D-amino-acid dehydrogenase
MSLVPTLAAATWIETRVGLRPASHDGFPYLGPAPGVDGLWLATGMGPSGLTLGPYCGSVVADQVLARLGGGPTPVVPAAFDPAR